MRRLVVAIAALAACGRGPSGPYGSDVDGNGRGDRDGAVDSSDHGDASRDGANAGADAATMLDAGGHDAPAWTQPLAELGAVSCWSVGGFQAVYHDQPAHIVVTLSDGDGIAAIATTADVTIIGHWGALYDVGPRALETLGTTGCCTTSVKVPITYDDFIAAVHAVGGPDDEFWSAYATFSSLGGSTVVARCDDEWFLEDAYYGN